MADAYQILSDCPNCRVQGAVVELMDPQISESESVEGLCRLCKRETALEQVLFDGQRFLSFEVAYRALSEWAIREGETDTDAFCQASLGGMTAREVVSHLLAQKVVETNFDVMAYLFFGMSHGSQGRSSTELASTKVASTRIRVNNERMALQRREGVESQPKDESEGVGLPMVDLTAPGLVARCLSAVMVVDGQIRRVELQFLANTLEQMGLPSLVDDDVRAWRPNELPTPCEPLVLLRLMIGMGGVDGALDPAEWRVIREFGRSWGLASPLVSAQRQRVLPREKSQLAVLWRGLKSLVVSEVR